MIFSFYSYKGGVGRTLTMVHTAIRLAATRRKKAYRVLLIDLDLEAPGLHLYLPQSENSYPSGFAGLLKRYRENGRDSSWLERNLENPDFIIPVENTDNLFFMPAGLWGKEQEGSSLHYFDVITSLRGEFPESSSPQRPTEGFFYDLQKLLKDRFTYVFIDSRTGFADEAYASTILLADALVLCFRLNEANIEGIQAVFGNFLLREQNDASNPELNIIPVAMPVPPRGGKDIEDWISLAAQSLSPEGRVQEVEDALKDDVSYTSISRIFLESTLEVGEHLTLKLSGEPEESYSVETPIVRSFYKLANRLAALNADRDVLSADIMETRYYRRNNWAKALEYLFKQIKLEPSVEHHWIDLTSKYTSTEALPLVKEKLTGLVDELKGGASIEEAKADPDRAEWLARALFYYVTIFGKQEVDAGLSLLEEARSLCNDNKVLIQIEFLLGQVIDEIIKEREATESFKMFRGLELSLMDACEHYTRSIELMKANKDWGGAALFYRAQDLRALGKHLEAIEDYDVVILNSSEKNEEITEKSIVVVLHEQAEALEHLGYYEQAFRNLRLASQTVHSHSVEIFLLVMADNLELHDLARQIREGIENKYSGQAHTYIHKALSLITEKRYDDALEACHLSNLYSGKHNRQILEGWIHILQGHYDRAEDVIALALENDDDADTKALYAYTLALNNKEQTHQYIEKNKTSDEAILWATSCIAAGLFDLGEEILTKFKHESQSMDERAQYWILKLAFAAIKGQKDNDTWETLNEHFVRLNLLPVYLRNCLETRLIHQTWDYLLTSGKISKAKYGFLAKVWEMIDRTPAPKLEDLPPRDPNERLKLT